MRKTVRISALVLALACSTYAGEIPNGTPQPQQLPAAPQVLTTDGEIPNGAASSLTETVLNLLERLRLLF